MIAKPRLVMSRGVVCSVRGVLRIIAVTSPAPKTPVVMRMSAGPRSVMTMSNDMTAASDAVE